MCAIDPDVLLAAIRECVTVVEAGEILACRAPADFTDEEMDCMNAAASRIREELGVRVLIVAGEEFARLKAGDAP